MARPIFRASALRRYNERLEKVELPRYATLGWARLWVACGLLLAVVAGLLWAADVPVYATGPGFVTGVAAGNDEVAVIALLPGEAAPRLATGQAARVVLPGLDSRSPDMAGHVVAVEAELLSPAAARDRFAWLVASPTAPVVVVHLTLAAALPGGDLWRGSPADVRVAVGAQTGLALLPGVDQLLGEG